MSAPPVDLYYTLDAQKQVVVVPTFAEWAARHESVRVVQQTEREGVRVSTIFMGLNHRHFGNGPPIVFETMIFGGMRDGFVERYCSFDDAVMGHSRACLLAFPPILSRNAREGRYAGKTYAGHWRSRFYRRPGQYNDALKPYMDIIKSTMTKAAK